MTLQFRVSGYEASTRTCYPNKKADGSTDISRPEKELIKSVKLHSIGGMLEDGSPVWKYSPHGELVLSNLGPEAWKHLPLDAEIIVNFITK